MPSETSKDMTQHQPGQGPPDAVGLDNTRLPQQAREAEAWLRRLQGVFNHVLEAILLADDGGRYIGANPTACALTGYDHDELLRLSVWDLMPGLRRERGQQLWQTFLTLGSQQGECSLCHKDGRLTEVEYRAVANIVPGLHLSALRDITARKVAEARQRLLAEVSAILSASFDYPAMLDSLARCIVPSLADWCVIDMLGEDVWGARLALAHKDPRQEGLLQELKRRYPRLHSSATPTLLRVLRTRQSWLRPELSAAQGREEAWDSQHWEILQALGFVSEMIVPLIARDRVLGTITFVLGPGDRRYGPDDLALAEDLAHRCALTIDNARLSRERHEATLAKEESFALVEETLRRARDDLERRVQERTADLVEANARLLREMAERQQAEAQLRLQQEALHQRDKLAAMGSLLVSVAHELNNPLSIVMMQADLLREESGNGSLTERPQAITQAVERCMRIVQHFLSLARQHPPERRLVQLNAIIEEACKLLAYALQVDNIEVELQLARDLPTLSADRHQLQQVVVNLVTNAHQALRDVPPPRRLTLTTRFDSATSCLRFEVADTGSGIPLALQARIFEPFFTTKPHGIGTGLGLSLCREFVEGHGGAIRVQSQPGQGTVFAVDLPIESGGSAVPDSSGDEALAPSPARTATILVIDDEPGIASTLVHVLSRSGHAVDTAFNGRLALAKLAERAFDLILCDLHMPELDGPAFYQELARHHPQLLPRTIFLTGDTLSPEARAFLEQVGGARLHKPFRAAEVRRIVHQVLQAL
jgi:PAS domain S-box-containing protein